MPRAIWANAILVVVWLLLAAALFWGWIPSPQGGQFQSGPAALLALAMVCWNLMRMGMILRKQSTGRVR